MGFILGLLIGAVIIYLVVKNGSKNQATTGHAEITERQKSFAEKVEDFQKPMNDFKSALPGAAKRQRIAENRKNGIACCPKCGSTSITANKKGVGIFSIHLLNFFIDSVNMNLSLVRECPILTFLLIDA